MESTYTGRKDFRRDGIDHFAEVTVRAEPGEPPSQVNFSPQALEILGTTFGSDFEWQRRCVWAAVLVQIRTANIKGYVPNVGRTSFHAEITETQVSAYVDKELSGFLLSAAGMRAIWIYLSDWEGRHDDDSRNAPAAGMPENRIRNDPH